MKQTIIILTSLIVANCTYAQYAPGVGELGCTAIYKDSSVIVDWANSCVVLRGFINIEDTTQTFTQGDITSNMAFFGDANDALGAAMGSMDVVSLGDGGSAVLSFKNPIYNGAGPDFVVFENGMKSQSQPYSYFLELAHVEVSTNGIDYVRFPSVSLTQTNSQIGTFENTDPTKIYNLAGKYEANYGTPFNLDDIADSINVDIDSILFVKIIDVVGDINQGFANYDSQGNIINDPYPTPFWTGGFDLDAVGVINSRASNSINFVDAENGIRIYPNPANTSVNLQFENKNIKVKSVDIYNIGGKLLSHYMVKSINNPILLNINRLNSGIYFIKINTTNCTVVKKLIKD